jgi:gluconolactonase
VGLSAKGARVEVVLLVSELGFPEGPVVMPDGGIVFCDGNIGELRRWHEGTVSRYAYTGGSPWGAVRGVDGALYVTQGGNVPGSGDQSAVCGIQRVSRDQTVELLAAEIDGYVLAAPNDLAFGPDGRLYFTDSGTEQDQRVDVASPGRLFVLDSSGDGEMLLERPDVCPNGIAFDAAGELYWTESFAHRVCRLENGQATIFAELPDDYFPDGMAFADDGRLFVSTNPPGVTVLSPDGEFLGDIRIGEFATNCIFSGSTLYVTATGTFELCAHERTGTLWRVETDATGLPLVESRLQ